MRLVIRVLAAALLAAPVVAAAGELSFTPYVWIPGVDGSVGTPGGGTSEGDRVSADFQPDLKLGGAMLNFSWREARFTAFGDWTYANVRADAATPRGALYSSASGQLIGNVVQLFSGYQLLDAAGMKLDAFVGGRGYGITGRLKFDEGAASAASTSTYELWFDAAAGLRWTAVFAEHYVVYARGDVGAGGSSFTWQAYGVGGYRFAWGDLIAGWRHLYVDKGDGDLQLRLALSGPVIGANFLF